jgi:thioredoxin 1
MKGDVRMNNLGKVIVVVLLVAAVGIVIAFKNLKAEAEPEPAESLALPKLVDLGAGTCIPCKLMAPILEELKTEFKDRLEVIFIDIRENPNEAKKYQIKLIPTQIFFDGAGKELFRHEGFYSREDILGKWKELGFDFTAKKEVAFSRMEPVIADSRSKDKVCYMCDGDIR